MKKLILGILLCTPISLHGRVAAQQPPPSPPSVRLGGDVVMPNLLVRVEPELPAIAQAARLTDDVMVDVLIDREGKVTPRTVVSGHPLLKDAALQAIRQWQFRPIVHLVPIDVIAVIPVRFSSSLLPDASRLPAGNAVISGQIRHADGRAISNAFVLASVAGVETPAVSVLVPADSTGAYRITKLPAGTYHIQAGTATGPTTYYPGVANLGEARTVSVAPAQTAVAGVDFTIP